MKTHSKEKIESASWEKFGRPVLAQTEQRDTPLQRLRHHVSGAIERGEKTAIVEQRDTATRLQDEAASTMRESALQDAKVKRWQGWDWKGYQTSITRQNYKLRDAERLAEVANRMAAWISATDGRGDHQPLAVEAREALAAWEAQK